MNKNKLYIIGASVFIIIIAGFMLYDFLFSTPETENVYEYNLDKFTNIDHTEVSYFEVRNFNTKLDNCKGIAVDSNDNIYVSGSGKINVFDKNGQLLKSVKTDLDAGELALKDDVIFIGTGNKLFIIDPEELIIDTLAIFPEESIITSIATTDSMIFIADAGTKLVYGISDKGNIETIIGEKDTASGYKGFIIPSAFFDLAIGRDNELWVVNPGRHQLESYNSKGKFISSWSKTSMELDGFSGCCNPTHIAILPDGSFVTSEKGIVRVKIVDPTGMFKTVVATPDDFDKGTTGLNLAVDSMERIIILDPKRNQVRILEKNKMETRKEFIIKSLRLAAFSVIATSTGYLIFNGKVTNNCEFEFACSNCKKKGCSTRKEEYKEVARDKQIKK